MTSLIVTAKVTTRTDVDGCCSRTERRGGGRDRGWDWEWRTQQYEELHDLRCSPDIVWVIKWWRSRCAESVARVGGEESNIGGFVAET